MDRVKQHCFKLFETLDEYYIKSEINMDPKSEKDFSKMLNLIMLDSARKNGKENYEQSFDEFICNENVIVPISLIEKNEDTTRLFAKNFYKFEELKGRYNSTKVDDFLNVFIEIAQNIPYHSMGSFGYVGVTSNNVEDNPYLSLTIADLGVGIRKSLAELEHLYRHFWNDSFAITLALKEKVSRLKVEGRGKGLAGVYTAVKKNEGTLWLRSGKGLFVHHIDDYEAIELNTWYPGVQCNVKIPLG